MYLFREKQRLQQDVAVKQEALVKSKEETASSQAELEENIRQRDQLEKQKKDTEAQLEEITNHVKL